MGRVKEENGNAEGDIEDNRIRTYGYSCKDMQFLFDDDGWDTVCRKSKSSELRDDHPSTGVEVYRTVLLYPC
jgi:hypothetical protein